MSDLLKLSKPCGVEGCTRSPRGRRSVCPMHSERKRRTGEYGPPQPLTLQGQGWRMHPDGYRMLYRPDHPLASKQGYVMEHRLVCFEAGLLSDPELQIHHRNGIKHDNRLENLEVLTARQHQHEHRLRLDHDAIVAAYASGEAATAIAARFNCDSSYVSKLAKRRGLRRNPR